jgi:hypothetical protein
MKDSKKNSTFALPDNVVSKLAAADRKQGFPDGTMLSLMRQEIGNGDRFLSDPTAYHYPLNAEGKRIAKHTGRVSTAFGPFGILESTAARPGYGVAPLKGKSFDEQLAFASEYLAGRSKQAGGLSGGLAGYGEGTKYAESVQKRRDGKAESPVGNQPVPVMMAAAPVALSRPLAQAAVLNSAALQSVAAKGDVNNDITQATAMAGTTGDAPTSHIPQGPDEWQAFVQALRSNGATAVQSPAPMQSMSPEYAGVNVPDFMAALRTLGPGATPQTRGFSEFAPMQGWG